jgi:drug/metabolite transporter (DMT)-like permease
MSSRFLLDALCAVITITIWAGWLVAMRIGMARHLAVIDLIALRFAVAGIVMVPVVMRRGWALDRLGWTGFAAIVIGGGAAYSSPSGRAWPSRRWRMRAPSRRACCRSPPRSWR